MNQFFSWLQKPYPLPDTKDSQFRMAVLLSLVVALFLFLIRPFNQHENTVQALTTALIGGATVFVTIYFHFLVLFPLFPRVFREERWTIGRELVWTIVVIISIALSNMALIAIWGGFPVTWRNLWLVIVDTTIIGIAPATASILINQARLVRRYRRQALALNEVVHRIGTATATQDLGDRKNLNNEAVKPVADSGAASFTVSPSEGASVFSHETVANAESINREAPVTKPGYQETAQPVIASTPTEDSPIINNTPLVLTAEIGKEQIVVAPADLLAISSADNYCKVSLREQGKVKTVILRSPLKRLEGMLAAHPDFWRCHRTAIVNLKAITGVGGTAQGYRLELAGLEETIPVSRSLNSQLREKLGAGKEQRF